MKSLLWRAMLSSDFNERYWRGITEKYSAYDFWVKVLLAVATSGTVASWGIWEDYKIAWKVLSAFAALLSVISPLMGFGKKVEVAASHAGLWADLRVRYADLWDVYVSGDRYASVSEDYEKLKKILLSLEGKEPSMRIKYDEKLARKCQQDVLRAKRIKPGDSR